MTFLSPAAARPTPFPPPQIMPIAAAPAASTAPRPCHNCRMQIYMLLPTAAVSRGRGTHAACRERNTCVTHASVSTEPLSLGARAQKCALTCLEGGSVETLAIVVAGGRHVAVDHLQ